MSYQVLARKWRPQSFDDVTGQASVVKTLQRALETGRIAHAFLFTGSRGIGKTTLARLLAKALSCEEGITPTPCGKCTNCVEIAEGKSVDIVEIDGASNTGVDDVRELREVARFMPQKARFKIFIIDEVHMLSTGAFNALLKTLEEPPEHVKFIFATTEAHKIPVTILSRCQRYDFKRIPTDAIVTRLREVLDAEKAKFDDGALTLIARAAEGGMRDALSLADQVLSFAGDEADAAAVTDALGLIDRRSVMKLVFAAIDHDARTCLDVSAEAFSRGHDVKQLADSLTQELRNLTVARATGSVEGFADIAPEDVAEIDERAQTCETRDLQRLFYMALDGSDLVQRADNPRLALELILLRMCDRPPLGEAAAISDAITRLEALARGKPVPPPAASAGAAMRVAREATGAPRETRSPKQSEPKSESQDDDPHPAAVEATPTPREEPPREEPPREEPPREEPPREEPPREEPPREEPPREEPPREEPPPGPPASSAGDQQPFAPPLEDEPRVWGLEQALEEVGTVRPPGPVVEEDDEDDEEEEFDPSLGYVLEGVDERWVDVVRDVAPTSKRLASLLAHAHVIAQEGGELRVSFERALHTHEVAESQDSDAIRAALARFGDGTRLVIVDYEDGVGAPSVAQAQRRAAEQAQQDLEEHARAHPVVQAAVDLFGGEVRSVKRE